MLIHSELKNSYITTKVFAKYITFERWLRYMTQKIALKLIRVIIFLLSVQLVLPAFIQPYARESVTNYKVSFDNPHDKGVVLSLFLKENNSEEKEGESENSRSFVSIELLNFAFLKSAITESHTGFMPVPPAQHTSTLPLHKEICVFLI